MPVYALLIGMFAQSYDHTFHQEQTLYFMSPFAKMVTLIQFSIFSVFAPGISLLMLYKNQAISSIEVDNRRERTMPIAITAIYCLLLGILLFVYIDFRLPMVVYAMPWGGFLAISLAGFINRKTKISMHALGAGMLFGFICSYYAMQADYFFEVIIGVVLVCGVVLSARVYLHKHTPWQVYSGFLLGALCMSGMIIAFALFSGLIS